MKPTEGKAEMGDEGRQRHVDIIELLNTAVPEPMIALVVAQLGKFNEGH